MTEPLVEVSFDLYKDLRRMRKVVIENDELDNYDDGTSNKIFGRVVKRPYLHYLFTSKIDYKIHLINTNFWYKSIVVRIPRLFKTQYELEKGYL